MHNLLQKKDWTVTDFSNYSGFEISTIYSFTHKRKIPFFKPTNGKIIFDRDDCLEFLRRNRISSVDEIEREAMKLQSA